jgi:hypothetical protein
MIRRTRKTCQEQTFTIIFHIVHDEEKKRFETLRPGADARSVSADSRGRVPGPVRVVRVAAHQDPEVHPALPGASVTKLLFPASDEEAK